MTVRTKDDWNALSPDDKLYEIFMSFRFVSNGSDQVMQQIAALDKKIDVLQRQLNETLQRQP